MHNNDNQRKIDQLYMHIVFCLYLFIHSSINQLISKIMIRNFMFCIFSNLNLASVFLTISPVTLVMDDSNE